MAWFERLSSLDFAFLNLEDRTKHMHVGGLALFEGPCPHHDELLRLVESRLSRVPRYRQRLAWVPFQQGRPVWVDEAQFDLEYHVRHTALPAPGSEAQLLKLTGRLMAQQLDRSKPLWEMWLIEGVGEDRSRFAIFTKTHHCMIDGISGMDIASVLMDGEPVPEPIHPGEPWQPRPAPSPLELLRASVKQQLTQPVKAARDSGAHAGLGGPDPGGHAGREREAPAGPRAAGQGAGHLAQRAHRAAPPLLHRPAVARGHQAGAGRAGRDGQRRAPHRGRGALRGVAPGPARDGGARPAGAWCR